MVVYKCSFKFEMEGNIKSLGADYIKKKISKKDIITIKYLIKKAKIDKYNFGDFKKFGSARKLYNFNIDNISNY